MNLYYIIYNGQKFGPMPIAELTKYGLNSESEVWTEGMTEWTKASQVSELWPYISRPADPMAPCAPDDYKNQYGGNYQNNNYSNNSCGYNTQAMENIGEKKVVFALLALFLGCFGVQYFYIGKNTAGIICLLLYWVSCGAFGLIVFAQAIVVLVMNNEDFDRKFLKSNSTMPLF